MPNNIMVLFDSLNVRKEAMAYSIELSKRMEASLVLLMLLSLDSIEQGSMSYGPSGLEDRVKSTLDSRVAEAGEAGISVEAVVKRGDPSSELMKFLAESGPIKLIVWGGEEDLMDAKPRRKKAHWLLKIKDMLEPPVLVPLMKS